VFTGIVEEIGEIISFSLNKNMYRIHIKCKKVLEDVKKGDSIAVNGACFTVVDYGDDWFKSDVMDETVKRTTLRQLKTRDKVNLERALKFSDRLGGHIVSGHIDGVGIISEMIYQKNALWLSITVDDKIMKYIIEKGSVAIDGISLTVAELDNSCFKVSLIPETVGETIIFGKSAGDKVNIECDIVGKYIEKFVLYKNNAYNKREITLDYLKENGF